MQVPVPIFISVPISVNVPCSIRPLSAGLLVELRLVTDGQTDGQTDGHRAMASTADAYTVASRGKNIKIHRNNFIKQHSETVMV